VPAIDPHRRSNEGTPFLLLGVPLNSDVEMMWELQQVLTQLGDREKQMSVKPEAFAEVDREYQAANEEVTRLTDSLDQLSKERRRVEGELSDQQELLKKYRGQLTQVKNQQQYAAAHKEIDATLKNVKELEDAALKQMGEVDALQKQLDDRRAGFDDLKSRYDTAYAAWQHSLGDLRTESNKLRKRADQLEAKIPERLKNEFYRIFKQRQNIAVAQVVSDSCSGCRTHVRVQVLQQLKRGEMVFCEGCRRILYWEKPPS
jgi:predicted  nucleic acid-binding Zn-ribbon protein